MAQEWKRVYVKGVGWRYTDGKSYRKAPPGPEQTVKAVVKGAVEATGKAAEGWKAAASKDGSGRTIRRTSNSQSDNGNIGLSGSRQRAEDSRQRSNKPSALAGRTGSTDVATLRQQQEEARLAQLAKANKKPETPKPPARASEDTPSQRTSTRSNNDTVSRATTGKPAAKASETYRSREAGKNDGKGLYQGTEEYRKKIGGSGNPLLNRFREGMGRDTATGNKVSQERLGDKAPNGKEYAGPAGGPNKSSSTPKRSAKTAPDSVTDIRKTRAGTSWGGVNPPNSGGQNKKPSESAAEKLRKRMEERRKNKN